LLGRNELFIFSSTNSDVVTYGEEARKVIREIIETSERFRKESEEGAPVRLIIYVYPLLLDMLEQRYIQTQL
jgi:hypothetical protein